MDKRLTRRRLGATAALTVAVLSGVFVAGPASASEGPEQASDGRTPYSLNSSMIKVKGLGYTDWMFAACAGGYESKNVEVWGAIFRGEPTKAQYPFVGADGKTYHSGFAIWLVNYLPTTQEGSFSWDCVPR